jgi:uncharacterized repeat protein (TIGR01451 family)
MSSPFLPIRRQGRSSRLRFGTAAKRFRRPRARPQVEGLESRSLLSVTINEFSIPPAKDAAPLGITAGPDGNLWFTEGGVPTGKIGEINPTTHAIAEFPLPSTDIGPESITTGPDGNLWFTELNGNKIGQINPTTHAIAEFPIPTAGGQPFAIAAGPDRNLWFTESASNNIGQAVLSAPAATAPDLAVSGTAPGSMTLGSDVTYTLTVTNNGSAGATGVTLTDTLPAGVTFVSAPGGVAPVNGVLTFTLGNLAVGASTSVTIVVTPTDSITLNNQARVAGGQADPTPADNSATQTTTVAPPVGIDGPIVTLVQRFGFHAQPTTLVLTFDTQLDPVRARDPGNYQIVVLDGPRRTIRVESAAYDPVTRTVTLSPECRLNLHHLFRLTVSGMAPKGVTDTLGNLLDGQGTGHPGSDFVTTVAASDLVPRTTDPAILRKVKRIESNQALYLGATASDSNPAPHERPPGRFRLRERRWAPAVDAV